MTPQHRPHAPERVYSASTPEHARIQRSVPSNSFQLQLSTPAGPLGTVSARFAEGRSELVLGSDPASDLHCPQAGVDPRHIRLILSPQDQILASVAEPASAARLNGNPLAAPHPLRDGDRIEFGSVTARVSGLDATKDPAPSPQAPPAPAPTPPRAEPPRADTQKVDPRKIEIPKSEHLRRAPQSVASPPSSPIAAHSTPPPEPVAPSPIIPPGPPPAPQSPPSPAAQQPPSIATLRPVGPATSKPANAGGPNPVAPPPARGDSSAASTRLRLATLRPATLRSAPPESAAKPAQPQQPPTRSIPPQSVAPGASSHAGPSFDVIIARMVSTLRTDLPAQAAPYTEAHLRALAIQARSNANTLGFTTDDHAIAFLKCIVLTGDDLASSDSKFPDIYFCLTLQGKPAEARIDRALRIANRVNARGGVGLAPMPTIDTTNPEALEPIHPALSAEEQVSEEILPSQTKQKSDSPPPSPSPAPPRTPAPPANAAPSQPKAGREARERDATQPMGQPAPPPRAPSPNEPPAPEKLPEIEGFKILEKIGAGGMGTVYRAYHHRLEVEVAIKIFKSLHPEAKTLLSREARAAARLQHPNIVQVLDYQEFGKGAYYAMQLVKGEDAHEVIVRVSGRLVHEAESDGVIRALGLTNDQLSPEVRSILQGKQPWHRLVAWWMAGVADGLDRAHREGIVHRDIKPSNLLLARDGRMTITDFGLALRRDDPTVGGNTARAGTPRYLAPERIADWASGADLSGTDGRIDTWALGATMYELLTYRPAYDGAREAVMRDIVTVDPLPPTQVIWAVPPDLDRICVTAMKRNPEERFQQAGEMASALRAWLMGDSGAKGPGQAGVFKRFKK